MSFSYSDRSLDDSNEETLDAHDLSAIAGLCLPDQTPQLILACQARVSPLTCRTHSKCHQPPTSFDTAVVQA